jgi:hypothetical protein
MCDQTEPAKVTVKTPPAVDTTQQLHMYTVRGQHPIDDKPQKTDKFSKFVHGVQQKVDKAVVKKAQKQLDKLVRVAGDGKQEIKNPALRFLGKHYTKHITRNSKQRTFSSAGADPIAVATVNIRAGIKQQVEIQLPKVDALHEGDTVYLAVFVTSGDSSAVGSAAWNERMMNPDAAFYYDISTKTNSKLADISSDINSMLNSEGDIVHKINEYAAKM